MIAKSSEPGAAAFLQVHHQPAVRGASGWSQTFWLLPCWLLTPSEGQRAKEQTAVPANAASHTEGTPASAEDTSSYTQLLGTQEANGWYQWPSGS